MLPPGSTTTTGGTKSRGDPAEDEDAPPITSTLPGCVTGRGYGTLETGRLIAMATTVVTEPREPISVRACRTGSVEPELNGQSDQDQGL